jgi:hypothetical protein
MKEASRLAASGGPRRAGGWRHLADFGALALCAALFAGGSAQAQSRPEVTKNGACSPSVVSELRDVGIAVFENMPLYIAEDLDVQVDTPLKFKTLVRLARGRSQYVSKERVFVTAELGGKSICGWAPAALLIDNPYPLSVGEVNEGRKPGKNPLYMKALIKSAPERAVQFKYQFNPQLTPVYNRPPVPVAEVNTGGASIDPNAYRIADARVFGIYYVYKVYVYKPGPETAPGKEQRWVYVAGSKPTDVGPMSGWINADDTYLWDTQISLYYNPKNAGAVDIYADMTALRNRDPDKRIASRPAQDMAPRERNIPRFPVLPIGNDNFGYRLNPTETAYRIGFFGLACLEDGSCSTGFQNLADLSQVAELVQQGKHIEVLFVVDNTLSMTNYFHPVANAVRSAVAEVSDKSGSTFRFAAAAYGDYEDNSTDRTRMKFELFPLEGSTSALDKLAALPTYKEDAMHDYPEAGFAAIVNAVERARWSPGAAARIVVWIGDHGNRAVGNHERIGPDDVRKVLNDNRIALFVPINVAGDYKTEFNNLFISDAAEVLELSKPEADRTITGFNRVFDTHDGGKQLKDVAKAAAKVHEFIEFIFKGTNDFDRWVQCKRGGCVGSATPSAPSGDINGFPVATLYKGLLKSGHYSTEALDLLYKTQSLMTDGYMRYNKKDRATEFWVSFPPESLRNLLTMSERFCDALQSSDVQDRFESTFFQLTQAVTGDPYDPKKETISEFLERVFHLPKENFSELFNRTTEDFSDWWSGKTKGDVPGATRQERERLLASVCRSFFVLSAVANNERIDLADLRLADRAIGRWELKNPSARMTFKWLFELENGVKLYFVPMSYMPGSASE